MAQKAVATRFALDLLQGQAAIVSGAGSAVWPRQRRQGIGRDDLRRLRDYARSNSGAWNDTGGRVHRDLTTVAQERAAVIAAAPRRQAPNA